MKILALSMISWRPSSIIYFNQSEKVDVTGRWLGLSVRPREPFPSDLEYKMASYYNRAHALFKC